MCCCLLVFGFVMFVVYLSLFDVRCWLFVVCWLLVVIVCRSLFLVRGLLFVVRLFDV